MNADGKPMQKASVFSVGVFVLSVAAVVYGQQGEFIPRKQTRPPGPALSPAEAIARMQVPEGFQVELVASEPDIVNPVAMTFDERGRIWITESLEYPRSSAGPGRDRVKVLEDTDGDGKADKFTIFAEGLNIPSGIAVGYGGVWVANAPDILFMQDTDGDGRADKQEVVVTGFGRADTHELPNSLTWGPDGWLYGLNGVFNPSKVVQNGKTFEFTCAMFRIHPRTREFQLFCEGTSNPWGIAFNNEGDAFVSACVIDHLWHLVETGYYHRQGGPYPPFTWKIESIVDHRHQLAAYCGIHWFDSDAYPPEYREKLYMGNIHGNCINVDRLERKGSTYKGHGEPDFLTANDVWFMPVVQKTGPDGCLYILDWYDRYHCYQDARRDPEGIDRLKGRLYRIRYKDVPRAPKFDLANETDDQLIERLKSPNVLFRDIAQRLLAERANPETISQLEQVLAATLPLKTQMHALWAMIGSGKLTNENYERLSKHPNSAVRAWAIRGAGNQGIWLSCDDQSADVLLQRVIASGKQKSIDALAAWLNHRSIDGLTQQIVWSNLHPLIGKSPEQFAARFYTDGENWQGIPEAILPRVMDRLLAAGDAGRDAVIMLVKRSGSYDLIAHREMLNRLAEKAQSREIDATYFGEQLRKITDPLISRHCEQNLAFAAARFSASVGQPRGIEYLLADLALTRKHSQPTSKHYEGRDSDNGLFIVQSIRALISGGDERVIPIVFDLLQSDAFPLAVRQAFLQELGKASQPIVGKRITEEFVRLNPTWHPVAIDILTQRESWSRELVAAVEHKQIPASAVNVNQLRKLASVKDPQFTARVKANWGAVRTERNPAREQIVADMSNTLAMASVKGNPNTGQQVFNRVCGQCHKIYGQGQDVGPDITVNGRGSFEQLLSNVFDPSLVIGAAYQAQTVQTADGRVLTGLVVEDSPQRVVLKVQGGKLETIARADVEVMETSKLSLMPEGLEKQLQPQELLDLFAFLRLDKPPSDPSAKPIPDVKK
jgi:putative heme-binding domain-containing protein